MEGKRLRVALFGRFCSEGGESVQSQKEKLREEAKKRNFVIVDEFWEEDLPDYIPLDERPEMKRFIQAVWMNDLDIDALFFNDLAHLSWSNRKEHLNLITLFEQNDITLITLDAIYDPNDWLAGLTF